MIIPFFIPPLMGGGELTKEDIKLIMLPFKIGLITIAMIIVIVVIHIIVGLACGDIVL
jgi:hypothetical protein